MRKIAVDMFFCKRNQVKQAITEYLTEVESLGGLVCPSAVMLGGVKISARDDFLTLPVFRLFSIQRRTGAEVKVVINISRRVES